MKRITSRSELRELARELGTRSDWHEPDEQGLSAEFGGRVFDNAGFWPGPIESGGCDITEQHVILRREREVDYSHDGDIPTDPVAVVNLATLFSWATAPELRARGHLVDITDTTPLVEWLKRPNGSLIMGRVTFEAVEGGGILVRTDP